MSEELRAGAGHDVLVCRATRGARLMTIVGAVLVLLTIYLAVASDDSMGLGTVGTIAIVMLVMGVWKTRNAYVTFQDDHFETRLTPAANWHLLLYSEVTRAELKAGKLLTIYFRKHNVANTARPKRIKIRLTEMSNDEREACVAAFRARLAQGVLVEVR
ncbi:hypothetical protein [Paraburkholderia sp.]|uniref:hypothetical protein n=1 Tax=Paraburkholderia sp. TaxID=1926495 RepID=UPI003D6DCC1E